MVDAVLSYHMDPNACGIARFSQALAKRLGVPFDYVGKIHRWQHPLVSWKSTEQPSDWWPGNGVSIKQPYDLFLHDWPTYPDYGAESWLEYSGRVYAGNGLIAERIRSVRPDAVEAFCPNTLAGNVSRGEYRVLTFGMVHKKLAPHFSQLKHRLDSEHPDYTVELSAAQHEGKTETIEDAAKELRAIFGDKLRVLGNLSDDALAKELRDVDAVALYYDPALRANNTTAWAALEAGKTLYTNTDEHSPPLDPSLHSWDMLCALLKGAV